MEKTNSFKYQTQETNSQHPWTGDFGFGANDRRYTYWRQSSFHQQSGEPHTPISVISDDTARPLLSRTVSSIDVPPEIFSDDYERESTYEEAKDSMKEKKTLSVLYSVISIFRVARSGNRQMKRLFMMISLNVAYSTAELGIGLFTGRVGLVSDAFHLTFGCGLLTFSLFAMAASRGKPDRVYTYGAGLILASWFLSLGVENAEVLCLGLVSVAVFMLVMPLFKSTAGVLLQMAPPSIHSSALNKCLRQVTAREDVSEVSQARFWELVPGHVVGSLSVQVKKGMDDRPTLQFLHGLYHDLGIQDLTVQTNYDD
uniref:Cation efflux protein transmembrane domain-containing protein n=1 Tax=Manihot esculenta TaxID=3983 RepID=A0A2C9V8U3_MANES